MPVPVFCPYLQRYHRNRMNWKNIFKLAGALADLLLPRSCIVCGRHLDLTERYLCLFCLADLPETHFWKQTHNQMADRLNETLLEHMNIGKYAYASALFFYRNNSNYRHITHQIKYMGNLSAGRHFGRLLGKKIASSPYLSDTDLIIPVPLHWTRRWKRGYNQAEIIAAAAAKELDADIRTDILQRHRKTRTQTKLDIAGKKGNVCDAFRIRNKEKLPPDVRHIILIDDVFTTGSTLAACYKVLRPVFPPDVRISVVTLGCVGY